MLIYNNKHRKKGETNKTNNQSEKIKIEDVYKRLKKVVEELRNLNTFILQGNLPTILNNSLPDGNIIYQKILESRPDLYPVYTDRPNPAFPPILPLWKTKNYA